LRIILLDLFRLSAIILVRRAECNGRRADKKKGLRSPGEFFFTFSSQPLFSISFTFSNKRVNKSCSYSILKYLLALLKPLFFCALTTSGCVFQRQLALLHKSWRKECIESPKIDRLS